MEAIDFPRFVVGYFWILLSVSRIFVFYFFLPLKKTL